MEFTVRGPVLNALGRCARRFFPAAFKYRILKMTNLQTERLALRPFDLRDLGEIAAWEEIATAQNPGAAAQEFLDYCLREYRERGIGPWAIRSKVTGSIVGNCGFPEINFKEHRGEVNCYIAPPYRNRGLATEALMSLFMFGFAEVGLTRIQARVDLENFSSQRLAEKAGMKFVGFLEPAPSFKNAGAKQKLYSVLRSEIRIGKDPTVRFSVKTERPGPATGPGDRT
jgi:[ribosomal protein S5]-alanine N-acetyltransferase